MDKLNAQITDLVEECNVRETQHEVTEQNLAFATKRITALELSKLNIDEFEKRKVQQDVSERAHLSRLEQMERTMRQSIDYMLRFQWKESRNLVNRAISKVVRPLQLKDLFYVNIGGDNHEIFQ